MSQRSKEFFGRMQEFFPSTREECTESIKEYGEVLETVVIEDIFMPRVLELLKKVFDYFEERVLETAKQYMGPETALLQIEADRQLGRSV